MSQNQKHDRRQQKRDGDISLRDLWVTTNISLKITSYLLCLKLFDSKNFSGNFLLYFFNVLFSLSHWKCTSVLLSFVSDSSSFISCLLLLLYPQLLPFFSSHSHFFSLFLLPLLSWPTNSFSLLILPLTFLFSSYQFFITSPLLFLFSHFDFFFPLTTSVISLFWPLFLSSSHHFFF